MSPKKAKSTPPQSKNGRPRKAVRRSLRQSSVIADGLSALLPPSGSPSLDGLDSIAPERMAIALDLIASSMSAYQDRAKSLGSAAPRVIGMAHHLLAGRPSGDSPDSPEISDSARFGAWVAECPRARSRVAHYLAEMALTGKIATAAASCGIPPGILAAIRLQHPAIAACEDAIRLAGRARLGDLGSETIEKLLDSDGTDDRVKVKAAEIAMRAGGAVADDQGAAVGGVNIQIIQTAEQPPAIPMTQVRGQSVFVQSHAK